MGPAHPAKDDVFALREAMLAGPTVLYGKQCCTLLQVDALDGMWMPGIVIWETTGKCE